MRTLLALLLLLASTLLAAQTPTAAVEVETAPLSALLKGLTRTAPATVQARHEAEIAAEIGGRIAEVRVDTGESVAAGAVLARLDDRDAKLALAQARAQREAAAARLSLAEVRAERGQRLGAEKFISADELKALVTEVQIAKAELNLATVGVQQAERALQKTVLKAPYALVVRSRLAQAGQQTSPGQPLFAVVDASAPEVAARVEAGRRAGLDGADIHYVDGSGRHPLTLVRVSPVLSPGTRTHEVRLGFANPGTAAAIGSEGRIEWQDREGLLPAEYLSRRNGVLGVFVQGGGAEAPVARFVDVPGAEDGRPFQPLLPAETRVITRGRLQLADGSPLKLAAPAAPPAAR
jgi:RND family efflux transporter MFP subunit